MKLLGFRTFLILFVTLVFIARFTVWNMEEYKSISTIRVKIQPLPDEKLSAAEQFWKFQKFLFPQSEIPNPVPEGIPNFCGLLYISLEKDNIININSEKVGNLDSLEILKEELKKIFDDRAEYRAFEANSDRVVKAVMIKAPLSASYGDVTKIVDAAKESGAEPVVLQIDELPQ